MLNGEICRKLENFSKMWGIKTNFEQNRCSIMWKFILLSERHFIKHSFLFLFHEKKYCLVLKGNPNSQGILNCIKQILQHNTKKQHKNIKNSQIIEENIVTLSLCPSLCLLRLALPSPSWQQFFSSLNVTSDHSWNI